MVVQGLHEKQIIQAQDFKHCEVYLPINICHPLMSGAAVCNPDV